jgi:hypothetical protein
MAQQLHALKSDNSFFLYFFPCLLLLLVIVIAGGCITEEERRGYSSLPQNRPADWEDRPYGDLRN